ncbi:hypothetical protein HMPREF0216_02402 [Clostridium celatum DSM 1785]|uniref:NERD domain-containing protein n=1 Tax=Clostridium celatum DSM 1785 TaxID=545697 RepID=L1QDT7_9CLOT|nr:hypothetical protein HMPREF0216_02402 [Clostridium celatum DSM 1785]
MVLVLVNSMFFIFRFIFNIIKFLIYICVKVLSLVLKVPLLRFALLLFVLGHFLDLKFEFLSKIYIIYIIHLGALYFNIYKRLFIYLNYTYNKLYNFFKVSFSLRPLKNESIILNNLCIENDDSNNCTIDDLVITDGGIFIIKTLNYSYNEFLLKSTTNNKSKSKLNNDSLIDLEIIYKICDECNNCYTLLKEIISSEIPITQVIVLPNEDSVVPLDDNIKIPIILAKDLPFFIKKNLDTSKNCSPLSLKNTLLDNKVWFFDILLLKLKYFISNNKGLLLFFLISLIFYSVSTTSVSYISFRFLK